MSMDRTQEFFELLRHTAQGQDKSPPPSVQNSSANVHFNNLSESISSAYDVCKRDLARLDQLARQRTLFDDKTSEIQTLTVKIKTGLTSLNSSVDSLEDLCRSGPRSGSPGSQHAAAHQQAILSSLRNRLLDLTKEFTDILQIRSRNLEQLDKRRGLYGQSHAATASSLVSRKGYTDQEDKSSDTAVLIDLEAGNHQTLVTAPQASAYHQSRLEAVEQIQRVVGELSTMFSRVAAMVGQQEEMVLRIDSTVDDSLLRLKEGQAHLLKYFNAISSRRGLIFKILAMLLVFACFFIIFLA